MTHFLREVTNIAWINGKLYISITDWGKVRGLVEFWVLRENKWEQIK